jgi:hypothetical protein
MRDLARKRGKSKGEAKDLVKRFSGHSLRAGFVAPLRIAQHTRHKSLEMVNRYCREADKFNKSALKGVLPRAATKEQQTP